MNFFPAESKASRTARRGSLATRSPIRSPRRPAQARRGRHLEVRPEHLTLSAEGDFATAGVVELVERLGEASYAHVRRADDKMTVAEIRVRRTPLPDERVQLSAAVTDIHVFDAEGHRVAAGS